MQTLLVIRVRLHGTVVEERVCRVRREIRLGDCAGAFVSFPGGELVVRRIGDCLEVHGRRIHAGPVRVRSGAVEIELSAVKQAERRWSKPWMPDIRLAMATLIFVSGAAWWETLVEFSERHPTAQQALWSTPDAIATEVFTAEAGARHASEADPLSHPELPSYPTLPPTVTIALE